MVKSIIQPEFDYCYICGRFGRYQTHHCLHGTGKRRLADADGLTVNLCPECHGALHGNRDIDLALIREAQAKWEEVNHCNGHEDFIKRYGKNFIED